MTGVHSNCKTILIDSECCDKTRYFVGMFDFPPTGEEKVLYVDESTGNVYIWDNDSDSYIGNAGTGSQGTQGTAGTPGIQGLQGIQGVQGIQGRQGTQGAQGTSIQGLQGIQGTSASLGCCCYAGLSIRELNPIDTVQNYKAVLTLFTECDLTGATVTWEVAPFIASYPYTTPPLAGPYVTNTIPLTGGNNLYLSLSDASGYWRVKIEKPGCCTIYSNPVYR